MRRSESSAALVTLGLVVLAVLLVAMVIFTARRFAAGPTSPTASPRTAAAPVVVERGRGYVRLQARNGAVWTYLAPTAPTDKSGAMAVPRRITLKIIPRTNPRTVGIGVRVLADRSELAGIQKDGDSVGLQVRLLDADGREVASSQGGFDKFGFT